MDLGRTAPAHVAAASIEVPLDALSRMTHEGLAFLDDGLRVAIWNDAAGTLTGVAPSEALDRSLEEFVDGLDGLGGMAPDEVRSLHLQFTTEPKPLVACAAMRMRDGWLLSFGPQRQFTAIEQMKSEIIAAVSHELKTPIATIKAYATTMRENPDAVAAEREEYLRTIDQQADRLAHAVDDLLIAARVDVAHLLKQRVRVLLDELIAQIVARLHEEQRARVVCASNGVVLSGDPDLLREALTHLIDNALKFSTGPVSIDASSDAMLATIRIRDTGMGIAADDVPYIFERFYRSEKSLTATTSGSGLGLYVARAVVRAHSGTITVESAPGSGSTFTVTLPVRP